MVRVVLAWVLVLIVRGCSDWQSALNGCWLHLNGSVLNVAHRGSVGRPNSACCLGVSFQCGQFGLGSLCLSRPVGVLQPWCMPWLTLLARMFEQIASAVIKGDGNLASELSISSLW
mmetsp:Transcript_53041/g.98141  ORF Transcript_53041/g.98141 Transcript_53041/m.98141 type:complete len:116 (-) Transcript_53041:309-656(-)